ncbi:MAG: peptidase C39 family protein, partial [Methanothrix sp.]
MKELTFAPLSILFMILLFSCASPNEAKDASSYPNDAAIVWFPRIDTAILSASENVDFIPNLKAYQQTTDYTCGPSALLSLAKFYGLPGIEEDAKTEMQIAEECGTRDLNSSKPGTKPQEMVAWLEKNGFSVQLEFEDKGDSTALQRLRDNIHNGTPTLV